MFSEAPQNEENFTLTSDLCAECQLEVGSTILTASIYDNKNSSDIMEEIGPGRFFRPINQKDAQFINYAMLKVTCVG